MSFSREMAMEYLEEQATEKLKKGDYIYVRASHRSKTRFFEKVRFTNETTANTGYSYEIDYYPKSGIVLPKHWSEWKIGYYCSKEEYEGLNTAQQCGMMQLKEIGGVKI